MITNIRLLQYSEMTEHPVGGIVRYRFSNCDLQGNKHLALLGYTVLQEGGESLMTASGLGRVMGYAKDTGPGLNHSSF